MPGLVAGTEWAAFYDELAAAFGLTIEANGPGSAPSLRKVMAGSPALATFVGEQTRLIWPTHYDLRRIAPCTGPTPSLPAFTDLAHRQPASRARPAPQLPQLQTTPA